MHAAGLTINRMQNRYLIGRQVSSSAGSKRRLDHMAGGLLAQTLGQALSPLLGDQPGVVVLEQLECELTLDAALSDQTIVNSWAAEIARVLSRRLRDESSRSMACFADADEMLGAFLLDLVRGRAWQSWVYRSFDGLKMLPLSAALRTAIVDDPGRGLRVLLAMGAAEREMLITALGEGESSRVLSELAAVGGIVAVDPAAVVAELLAKVDDWVPRFPGVSTSALWIFLVANGDSDRHSDIQQRLIREIVSLRMTVSPAGPRRTGRTNGDATLTVAGFDWRIDETEIIASLPANLRERIVTDISRLPVASCGAEDEAIGLEATKRWFMQHGGALLLLRFIAQWPFDELPGLDAERANWLRLAILAKALGRTRFVEVFNCPSLRELLGLHPGPTVEELIDWLLAQPAVLRLAWMERLGKWRRAQWPSEPEDQVLCNRHGLQHIVSEPVKGAWLFAVHADTLTALREYQPRIAAAQPPRDHRVLRRSLADFHFLRLPLLADQAEDVDLTLSVLAQGILRDMAFSLPGFSGSSLDFLYRNFLDFGALIEPSAGGYQVHLSRPPLNIILNMTGLQRGHITLPWRSGVDLELFPESG